METMNAFEFAMAVYGISVLVTLLVWLVIIAIRRIAHGRARL